MGGFRLESGGFRGGRAGLTGDNAGLCWDLVGLRVRIAGLRGDVAGLRGDSAEFPGGHSGSLWRVAVSIADSVGSVGVAVVFSGLGCFARRHTFALLLRKSLHALFSAALRWLQLRQVSL